MVSKNNLKYYEQRHALYQKPHFGLRKLSIGVASVLLSTTFFLGKAHADEVTGPESNDENVATLNNNYNSVNSVGIAQYSARSSVQGQNSQQSVSLVSSNPIDVESLNVQNVQTGNNIGSNVSTNYLNNMKYQSLSRVNNSINMNTDMYNSNLDNSQVQTDPVTTKAVYNSNEDVQIYDRISNNTAQDQNFTTEMGVYDADQPILFQTSSNYLKAESSIDVDNNSDLRNALKIPHNILEPNHGYLVKVNVYDQASKLLSSKSLGLSVEDDWKVFPKYGAIAGSGDYGNSIINNSDLLNRYKDQMQEMARMHINSDFYYDVYKSPANPLPETIRPFQQTWSWWSGPNGSTIDPEVVKNLVRIGHDYNQSAMLYNMISAKTNDETPDNTPGLPDDSQLVYNFNDGAFGKKGTPMTNTMKSSDPYIAQIYYNPASPSWIDYIADTMASAINRGGFDGWQGDTIGDAQVTTVENKGTNDSSKSFNMSDTYAYFSDQLKKNWKNHGYNYDFTLNAVGGNGLIDLSKNEDVAYVEVWPNSSYDGRNTSEYGDLKWMVDKVRQASGKSLIIAAYLKNNQIVDGKFNTNAQLLVDATVAAAGGYHMTIAANGNSKDGNHVGVLDNEYYPNQEAGVSDDLNRKLYNYQQFITAYENVLRGSGVENDDTIAKVFDANGHQMSRDDNSSRDSGRNGNQVWTFTKHGSGFETIQLINLMGINSDWDNTSKNNNKNPVVQHNFTVRYPLNNMPADQARLIANNVYVMSPDDWNHGTMQKINAYVDQSNGNYDLVMKVPTLDIWDMIYFKTSAPTNQLVHYEYKDGDSLLATGTSNVSIENGQYNVSKLTPPSGYKIKNDFVPVDASNMLVSIPVEKLPVVQDTIKIVDVDDNNKVLSSQTVASLPSNYDSLVPVNYSLAGYNIKGQTLTIKVRHNVKSVTENKTVTRNIVIIDPTGHRQEGPQSVTFGRAGVKDLVTGQTNWKSWDPASATFDAINTPEFPGYTKHGSVDKITVTPDSQDSTVTITYTKNDSGSHSDSQTSSASSSASSQTSSVSLTASSVISSTSSSAASLGSSQTSSGSVVSPTIKFVVDVIDVDENNRTLSSNEVDHLPSSYDSLIPTNYSLAGYNITGQTLTIKVRHNVKSVTENKMVTRNIVIVDPMGRRQTGQQQVTFGRSGIEDLVTGHTSWKAWDPANASFDEISTPDFPGYIKHGSIDKMAITPDSQDSTVTITYAKNDSGSHSGSQTSSAGSSTASSTQSLGSTASSSSSSASRSTSSTSSSAGSSSSSQTSSGSVVSPTVKFVVDVIDVDKNNKTLSSNEVDHLPSSYDSLIPKNYSLAGYSIKDQMLTIKVRHNVKTVTENKTVTRHIVMIDPFGRRQTGDQSVTFGRAGVQDLVTGNTVWKAWDPESHQFKAVDMPAFVGYKPSINVNTITVTPDSKDITLTVVYTKTGSDSNVPGSSTVSSANSSVTSSAMSSTVSSTTSSTASSTMSSAQNSSATSSVGSATISNIDSNTSSVSSSVASSTASSFDSSVVSSTQISVTSSANSSVSSSVIISSANSENSSQASSSVINSDVNNSGVNSITSQNSQVDNISNSVVSSVVIGSNSLATVNSQTEQQSEIHQSLNSIMNSVSSFNDAGNQNIQANSNVQAVQNNAGQADSTLQKVQPSVTTNSNGDSTMTVPLGAVVSGQVVNITGTVNNQAEAGRNGQSTGSAGLLQTGKSDQDRAMFELGLAGGMFVLGLAGTNKKLRKKRQ